MSTKTITLSEDAYEQLKSVKGEKESFSDVVRRLTARKSLVSFAGLLTSGEATALEAEIGGGRIRSRKRERGMQ